MILTSGQLTTGRCTGFRSIPEARTLRPSCLVRLSERFYRSGWHGGFLGNQADELTARVPHAGRARNGDKGEYSWQHPGDAQSPAPITAAE